MNGVGMDNIVFQIYEIIMTIKIYTIPYSTYFAESYTTVTFEYYNL